MDKQNETVKAEKIQKQRQLAEYFDTSGKNNVKNVETPKSKMGFAVRQ